MTIEQILATRWPAPLSTEIRQRIIDRYGAAANPDQAVTLRCEDVTSLIDTVRQSDAVFLGIVGAARQYTASGEVVELNTQPTPAMSAKFALVTPAGRTEPPAMAILRAFVRERLRTPITCQENRLSRKGLADSNEASAASGLLR